MVSFIFKIFAILIVGMVVSTFFHLGMNDVQPFRTGVAIEQMESIGPEANAAVTRDANMVILNDLTFNWSGGVVMLLMGILLFFVDLKRAMIRHISMLMLMFLLVSTNGCFRIPYEPQQFETAKSNEEMFMIPLRGDTTKQAASQNEELLRRNLVFAKQVRIPQQWIQTGRQEYQGTWVSAAIVIKVDKSPVTREWTADPNSGTSNKNEAIWG